MNNFKCIFYPYLCDLFSLGPSHNTSSWYISKQGASILSSGHRKLEWKNKYVMLSPTS